jgi:hypothetical protein
MRPGQHRYMNMTFKNIRTVQSNCPHCNLDNETFTDKETIWLVIPVLLHSDLSAHSFLVKVAVWHMKGLSSLTMNPKMK